MGASAGAERVTVDDRPLMTFRRRRFRRFRRRHHRLVLWGKWLVGTAIAVALIWWLEWL